jgi:MFS transporter, OFA family, oxalate/formate antiporter
MPGEKNNTGVFYGWFTMGACFAVLLIQGGTMWTFGVFLKPMAQDLQWTRARVSSGYTAFLIGFVISVIITGRLSDRYSPGPILLVSAILTGLGFSLCSHVHTVHHLRMVLFIGGLGGGANWSVPTSTVQRWFFARKRAGLALGITISGVGVGAFIFALLSDYLVSGRGWRDAYLMVGIIFFAVMAASSFVVKKAPGEPGALPDGSGETLNRHGDPRRERREILKSLSFIGITVCHCIAVIAFQIIAAHLVPYATDIGIPSAASAAAIGLMGISSIPGRIIGGYLSGRIPWQRILAFSHVGMGLSVLLLLFLQGPWMLYCFVLFYGLCHGSRVSGYLGILGGFFSMGSLGELIGITMAIGTLIGAFAPYLAGLFFDVTGSYRAVFAVMSIFFVGSGILASMLRKPDMHTKMSASLL